MHNAETNLSSADVAGVLPPLVVQKLDRALLLEAEDGHRERVPPGRPLGRGDPVALRVEQAADLCQVAVALGA